MFYKISKRAGQLITTFLFLLIIKIQLKTEFEEDSHFQINHPPSYL